MYCITNRIDTAVLAGCILLAFLPAAAAQEPPEEEGRFLSVHSEGYSRFEIDGDSVVAFFTDGVEFDYLGFNVSSGELHYNHADQIAEATGTVVLRHDGAVLTGESLVLDGGRGSLELSGGIAGSMDEPSLEFECERLVASFPPRTWSAEISEMDASLLGGVVLTTAAGHRVHSDTIEFNGAELQAATGNGFSLVLGEQLITTGPDQRMDLSGMEISGEYLAAQLNEDLELESVEARDITGSSESLDFSMHNMLARIPGTGAVSGQPGDSEIQAEGFTCLLSQDGRDLHCQAQHGVITLVDSEIALIRLLDSVEVTTGEGHFNADELNLVRTAEGYTLDLPAEVQFDFDLVKLGGIEPVRLDSERGLLGDF